MSDYLLTLVVLAAGSFIAAIGVVILLGFTADRYRVFGRWFIPMFVPAVLFGIAFKTISLKRNLSRYSEDTTTILGAHSAAADWVLRMGSAFIVGTSLAIIIAGLFSRVKTFNLHSNLLFAGFFVYFLFNTVANGVLGSVPSFDFRLTYFLIAFLAIHLSVIRDIGQLADFFKFCGLATICGGLLTIFVSPSMAIQPNYESLLPFVTIRLWGIDAHANGLGPLCAVVALVLLWRPLASKSLQAIFLLSCITALFLTQSKTAIAAFLCALFTWGLYKLSSNTSSRNGLIKKQTSMALAIALCLGSCIVIIYFWSDASIFTNKLNQDAVQAASQLSGRRAIWVVSFAEFKANPLFGYGNLLWGPEFAGKNKLLGVASNAHNQLIEVLSAAGLFGFSAFIFYLSVLIVVAWKAKNLTEGFSIALMTFLIVRGIPEAPFKINNLMSNDFLIHLLLFALLCWTPASKGSGLASYDSIRRSQQA